MPNERGARRTAVRKPENICLACFNAQQRFAFPFLVYCIHHRVLALFHSANETSTFACAAEQLAGLLARLDARRSAARVDHGARGDVEAPLPAEAER